MSAIERLLRPEPDKAPGPPELAWPVRNDDPAADLMTSSCFVFVRGQRGTAGTLTLKSPGGNAFSLDWTWTPDIVFLPGFEVPLTLLFSSRGFKIEIIGSHLELLVAYLQQRRVVSIEAQDRMQHLARGQGTSDEPHVDEFRIVPLQEGEDVTLMQHVLQERRNRVRGRERLEPAG